MKLNPGNPLLDHHRINKAAVLPGVGGIEIMRAAAGVVHPSASDLVIENLRFVSPIKVFKEDPFEVQVEIRADTENDGIADSFKARICSWFRDKEGRKVGSPRLHHESDLRFVPRTEAPSVDPETWAESVWIPREDIYEVFFHGPGFMLVEHLLVEGNGKGIRFRYRDTPEVETMFEDRIPAAIEAVFQAGAGFGLENSGIMALPTGIDRAVIRSSDSLPRDGELRVVKILQDELMEGRTAFRFDGYIRDAEGRIIVELEGIEMVELQALPGFPSRIFQQMLPVKEIVEAIGNSRDETVDRLLHEKEVEELATKATPKRAAEWLAGRAALKRIVRRVASVEGRQAPEEKRIRIVQDANGKPSAEISGIPADKAPDLSLSHSNGLAMAAAAVRGSFTGIGIDLEKIEVRSDSWVRDYFTDEEIRSAGNTDNRWLELTKRWCLKEAALKAMGTGLRFDLRDINVAGLDRSGNAVLEFRNEALSFFRDNCRDNIIAKVERHDNLVLARVLMR